MSESLEEVGLWQDWQNLGYGKNGRLYQICCGKMVGVGLWKDWKELACDKTCRLQELGCRKTGIQLMRAVLECEATWVETGETWGRQV